MPRDIDEQSAPLEDLVFRLVAQGKSLEDVAVLTGHELAEIKACIERLSARQSGADNLRKAAKDLRLDGGPSSGS